MSLLVRSDLGPLATREEGTNSATAFALTSSFISLCFSQFHIAHIIEQREKVFDVFAIEYLGLYHHFKIDLLALV